MRLIFYSFTIANSSSFNDVELAIAEPMIEWKNTEHGTWVMQHCNNLTYHIIEDNVRFCHKIDIVGTLTPGPALTEYLIKWHNKES
jgi:hypothetical protein